MSERIVEIDGKVDVLTNDYDKIRYITALKLRELGWSLVINECSGAYEKAGFKLFLFPKRGNRATRLVARTNILANVVRCFDVPRVSWQLEKYGALVATGKLSLSLSYIYNTDYWEDKEFQAFIAEVESYLVLSKFQLAGYKTIYKDLGSNYRFVPSESNIIQTRYFLCTSNPIRLPQFLYAHAYGILQLTRSAFSYVEFNSNGSEIGDVHWLRDEEMTIFMELASRGVFRAISLVTNSDNGVKQVVLQHSKGDSVPEEILKLNYSDEHNKIISIALNKRLNVMPLLRKIDSMETLRALYELISVSKEYAILQKVTLNVEWIQILKQAAAVGFSLYDFVEAGSASIAKEMLLESVANFDSIFEDLRQEYTVSAITGLKFISTSANKFSNISNKAIEQHVFLQQMLDTGIMISLVQDMLKHGRCQDRLLYVFSSEITKNARAELRVFLSADEFVCRDREWNNLLESILRDMRFIGFTRDTGFIVSAGDGYVGRQPGGFVFYNKQLNPEFRAFKLNGEYVRYGNEDIIALQ